MICLCMVAKQICLRMMFPGSAAGRVMRMEAPLLQLLSLLQTIIINNTSKKLMTVYMLFTEGAILIDQCDTF